MIKQIDIKQAAERLEKGEDVKVLMPEIEGDWTSMRPFFLADLLAGALFFGEEEESKKAEPVTDDSAKDLGGNAKQQDTVKTKQEEVKSIPYEKPRVMSVDEFVDEVCAMGKKEEPKKKPKYDHFEIMAMYDQGAGPTEIAREIGCSPRTVINILTKEGVYKK